MDANDNFAVNKTQSSTLDIQMSAASTAPANNPVSKPPAKAAATAKAESKAAYKNEMSMKNSTREGMLNSAASSITSTYTIPLALALGASSGQVGLLNFIQNGASTFGHIPGAYITKRMSRKAIWLLCQIISKIAVWLPVIFFPVAQSNFYLYIFIVLVAIAAFFSSMRGPAWASLMGDIVPQQRRGRYFANRNALAGASGLAAVLVSGYMLAQYGFGLLFLISVTISFGTIYFFLKMHEPSVKIVYHFKPYFGLPKDIRRQLAINRGFVIFTAYLAIMYAVVEIAAPFYVVYMLKDLSFDYVSFAFVVAVGAVVRILAHPYWGKINDRFGSRKVLVITGVFTCFTPLLWIFVSGVESAFVVKIFDGFVWAGFDLVAFNYLLDVTPADRRPFYVANHNLFAGLGVMVGALAGAVLASQLENATFLFLGGLQIIFLISFVGRLLVLPFLTRIREAEVSQTALLPVRYVFWRIAAVEPTKGVQSKLHYTFRYPDRRAILMREFSKKIDKTKFALGRMKRHGS